jgi:hypothetical protein
MARPPHTSPWELLLRAGRTAEEQFDLLERARCLSPKALAGRPAVVALVEQVTTSFRPRTWIDPPGHVGGPPLGWEPPSLWGEIQVALYEAGYLDEEGWRVLMGHSIPASEYTYVRNPDLPHVDPPRKAAPGYERMDVERIIAEVHTIHDAGRGGSPQTAKDSNGAVPGPPSDSPSAAGDDVTCWRCRRHLPPSAAYCGYCGTRLGAALPVPGATP